MILLVNLPRMTWEGAYFSIYDAVLALYISGSGPEKRAVALIILFLGISPVFAIIGATIWMMQLLFRVKGRCFFGIVFLTAIRGASILAIVIVTVISPWYWICNC